MFYKITRGKCLNISLFLIRFYCRAGSRLIKDKNDGKYARNRNTDNRDRKKFPGM